MVIIDTRSVGQEPLGVAPEHLRAMEAVEDRGGFGSSGGGGLGVEGTLNPLLLPPPSSSGGAGGRVAEVRQQLTMNKVTGMRSPFESVRTPLLGIHMYLLTAHHL